jgi:hypothetical protein
VLPKKQLTISSVIQNCSKQVIDAVVARAFYANGIPFSVIDNKYFKDAINAIAQAGPSYRPPNRQALSDKMLTDEGASQKNSSSSCGSLCHITEYSTPCVVQANTFSHN